MPTKSQVFITVAAISALTSGCIFGGGGDKKRAAAAREAALAEQTAASNARADVVARALKPQASAVEWPKPEEFRLSNEPPAREPVAARRGKTAAAPPPAAAPGEIALESQVSAAAEPDRRHASHDAAAAVANQGLELTDPAQEAHAEVPAAAPAADVEAHAPAQPARADTAGDELSPRIAQRLRDNPRDLSTHLDYQLQRFLADESVPDLSVLSPLPAEDRELLTALLDGLSNFRNGLRSDDNMLLSKKVRPLLELAARLRSQAELSIPTIALCRGVSGFGNYEPVDGRFVAQKRSETIVYCEIGNVSSQQTADGVWESKLTQEAVLYTEDGQRVWSNPALTTPDRSRNRRQDFFVAQKIALPPNLSIDRYILKVTVTDQQVGRVAEATVPIQIVASLDTPPLVPLAIPAAGAAKATGRNGPARADGRTAPPAGEARPASERQPAGPRADLSRGSEALEGK